MCHWDHAYHKRCVSFVCFCTTAHSCPLSWCLGSASFYIRVIPKCLRSAAWHFTPENMSLEDSQILCDMGKVSKLKLSNPNEASPTVISVQAHLILEDITSLWSCTSECRENLWKCQSSAAKSPACYAEAKEVQQEQSNLDFFFPVYVSFLFHIFKEALLPAWEVLLVFAFYDSLPAIHWE